MTQLQRGIPLFSAGLEKRNHMISFLLQRHGPGPVICLFQDFPKVRHLQHIYGKAVENIPSPVIIVLQEPRKDSFFCLLFTEIRLYSHLFCFRKIFFLIPV